MTFETAVAETDLGHRQLNHGGDVGDVILVDVKHGGHGTHLARYVGRQKLQAK